LLAGLAAATGAAAQDLSNYNVELARTSVSGVSSGAYMAGQLHVIFSAVVSGAGLVAGGPYYCAEGSLSTALERCMKTTRATPEPARLLAIARDLAVQDEIDDLANLANDKVYLFTSDADETVLSAVVEQARAFYRLAGVPDDGLRYVTHDEAGHAMITDDDANACPTSDTPFLNDCDYDQAGDILAHIYGPLNPKAAEPDVGPPLPFDQGAFLFEPKKHGMDEVGYLYLPASCREGRACKLHVALHGCRQTPGHIGGRFLTEAGYNDWAETNDLIVLYPQAHTSRRNPLGCWDWWGYEGANYHLRTGRQAAAIMGMVKQLAGREPFAGYCAVHRTWNYSHWWEDRAHLCGFLSVCANGSGENLGFSFFSTTLYEPSPGRFSTTDCSG
jgi:poly(3-hydroxybutyrate) depolymerase